MHVAALGMRRARCGVGTESGVVCCVQRCALAQVWCDLVVLLWWYSGGVE